MKNFYNTIQLNGKPLQESISSNIKQEDRIFQFMKEQSGCHSCWDIHQAFPSIPITSIRRALFNLKEQAKIHEVGMTIGNYGKPVFKYTAQTYHQFNIF